MKNSGTNSSGSFKFNQMKPVASPYIPQTIKVKDKFTSFHAAFDPSNISNVTEQENIQNTRIHRYKMTSNSNLNKSNENTERNKSIGNTNLLQNIPKSIIDVEKSYFKIVEKRIDKKFNDYTHNSRQNLKVIKNCLIRNIVTGYCYDEIFKADVQLNIETEKVKKLKNKFSEIKRLFHSSLNHDYDKSIHLLQIVSNEEFETQEKRIKLKKTEKKLLSLKNVICDLQDLYEKCKLCMRFYCKITHAQSTSQGKSSILENRVFSAETFVSDNQSIEMIASEIAHDEELRTEIHIFTPIEIYKIVEDIEHSCFKILQHSTSIKNNIYIHKTNINTFTAYSRKQSADLRTDVQGLQNRIDELEGRGTYIRKWINNELKNELQHVMTGSENIIFLEYIRNTFVSIFHEECPAPIQALAQMEKEYLNLMFRLEQLPQNEFRKEFLTEKEVYKKSILNGIDARKRIARMDASTTRILKTLDPPRITIKRKLGPRLMIQTSKKKPPKKVKVVKSFELKKHLFVNDYIAQPRILSSIVD